MPKLGQYTWILETVFFLYPSSEDAAAAKQSGGTGFLVTVPSKRWPDHYHHVHGVTNWHVACRGSSVIRLNRHIGAPDILEFDPAEWVFKASGPDVAISPPLDLNPNDHKVQAMDVSVLLTQAEETSLEINAGDDVFMAGRFIDVHSSETTTPALRFGHISMIDVHLKQETGYEGRSIIIDMHSRTGFSGSPVFVYRTAGSIFTNSGGVMGAGHTLKLLGIHYAQFPEMWELKDGAKARPLAAQVDLSADGKYVEGMSGMTCAVPAAAILDLLNDPRLVRMREAAEIAAGTRFGLLRTSDQP